MPTCFWPASLSFTCNAEFQVLGSFGFNGCVPFWKIPGRFSYLLAGLEWLVSNIENSDVYSPF